MSAIAKVRILAEVVGQDSEKRVSCLAAISDTPTQAGGPYTQVFTTAAKIDLISVLSGQLIGLYIKAVSSGLYVNPSGTVVGALTAIPFIPEGQFNYYTFKTGTSCVPWAECEDVRAEAELWYIAVS